MAVKLRLQRKGKKNSPFYFIVAADSRSPRGGKFIEKIGTYNPLTIPANISINRDSAIKWLQRGAQPTNTVRRILSFKGVSFWKHLLRGVSLGLFDLQTAEKKYAEWTIKHDAALQEKQAHTKKHKEQILSKVWEQSSSIKKARVEAKEKSNMAAVDSAETMTESPQEVEKPSEETNHASQ